MLEAIMSAKEANRKQMLGSVGSPGHGGNTDEGGQRDELPEDWLANAIRKALQSSVGNAEPPPAIWTRIRENIEAIALSHQEGNMLSYQDLLVRQEHYKGLLQEAEHERLIQAAGLRQPGNWRLHRKFAGWIGSQMVRWGWKLQSYGTNSTTPLSARCQ
jgi:hypothetical protein